MTNFSYQKISKTKKIRYISKIYKDSSFIVFLHGFMSDLEGKKPNAFLNFAKKNKIILVGSSMGAWISLNQFKFFKKQIVGFLGIGSAPEFLENLMWKKFSKKMKSDLINNGIHNLKHGDYVYPITHQLIKDGRKNKVLNKEIKSKIHVTMIHGQKDEAVPVSYSRKVLKIFKNAKKKLVIIKNGDHSLSSPKWLKLLKKELSLIVS